MIKSQQLLWYRTDQKELRIELYQGLSDAFVRGETEMIALGKRVMLLSSFIGGAHYMLQNYLDAMAICRATGYPDLFLTFTCIRLGQKSKDIVQVVAYKKCEIRMPYEKCERLVYIW